MSTKNTFPFSLVSLCSGLVCQPGWPIQDVLFHVAPFAQLYLGVWQAYLYTVHTVD